ncbi:hypothetical protein EON82_13535 [bacterium]|nr:MAG: hypothetical protein EON82_13535 [bacterium]
MLRRTAIFLGSFLPLAASLTLPPAPQDRVGDLVESVKAGTLTLPYEPKQGYLRALLKELRIDPASQVLVFSKGSLQADHIGPKNPRAIYFNADTYVGWIPGAPMIEIASIHPKRGVVFYTIPNGKEAKATFETSPSACDRCHGAIGPDLFATSAPTSESGYPRAFARSFRATPDLPFNQRWAGWYVTGTHGAMRHLGNELSVGDDEKNRIDVEKGANVTDLKRYFDVSGYLTPHSDIAALMVFEQQMHVQNVLTRTVQQTASDESYLDEACEELVEALLCVGEAKLTAPLKGTSAFPASYAAGLPKDSKGRSLGDLDLKSRVLKYPCSPLIYSASFDALPAKAKEGVYKRLKEILTGKDTSGTYAHLTATDRQALLQILKETKSGFKIP